MSLAFVLIEYLAEFVLVPPSIKILVVSSAILGTLQLQGNFSGTCEVEYQTMKTVYVLGITKAR